MLYEGADAVLHEAARKGGGRGQQTDNDYGEDLLRS